MTSAGLYVRVAIFGLEAASSPRKGAPDGGDLPQSGAVGRPQRPHPDGTGAELALDMAGRGLNGAADALIKVLARVGFQELIQDVRGRFAKVKLNPVHGFPVPQF
jgi:hypothetical protein